MAYQTIPTVSNGQVLTASYLNLLSANIGFVYGVANQANTPFNSFRAIHVTLDRDIMQWSIRHKCQYLHWKITAADSWNYARLYWNGIKLGHSAPGNTWTGVFNLWQWAGLPNLVGAWASGVAYQDSVGTDGSGGNDDDGTAVTQSGQTYRCKVSHTSAAGNQPGIGASWTTYWDLLTLPGNNTMCVVWADVNFNSGIEVTVEYILETTEPTFS